MADISDQVDPIAAAIFEQYEKRGEMEKSRTYLGASVIGRECARALWYGFRWARKEKFDGRTLRLFQTGHMSEGRFVADLRSIGCEVYDVDPATGRQFGFESLGGHMRGHMDGCAKGIPGGGQKWHVVEFKTHSAKSFSELKKKGVRAAKPEHWAQMNWYMGKSSMSRALYVAVNKDNDDLYTERLEFDQVEFERTEAKAERIIFSGEPPPKISDDPKFYLCNWCTFNGVCHGGEVPAATCRTCVHATPTREGNAHWACEKHKPDVIPVEIQRTGCNSHLTLPFLVTYADPMDAGDDWILFQRKDNGRQFIVRSPASDISTSLPCYTTHEIAAARDHRAIADPGVEEFRTNFNGTIVG
jgi:hypothetical protein